MLIDKDSFPRVAVPSMNATHEEEIALINGLDDLISAKLAGEDVEAALAEAIEAFRQHVEQHFANEEALMQQFNFPVFPIHKGEHDRVRQLVHSICDNWQDSAGFEDFVEFIRVELPDWLNEHVSTMDMVTAHFLSEQGVT